MNQSKEEACEVSQMKSIYITSLYEMQKEKKRKEKKKKKKKGEEA